MRESVHCSFNGYASLFQRAAKLSGPKCFLSCLDLCACLVTQLYPALRDPMDYSPPGSSVHGIFFFSREEYWNGLPFLPPGALPNSGIEPVLSPVSLASWVDPLPNNSSGRPCLNLTA